MQPAAVYNPDSDRTPLEKSLIEQRRQRLARMRPKPIEPPPLPPIKEWAKRQVELHSTRPSPVGHWFWIEEEIASPAALQPTVRVRDIIRNVADYYSLTTDDLLGPRRDMGVMKPRMIGYYLCRILTRASSATISRHFGRTDHTTARNGIRKIHRMRENPAIEAELRELAASLGRSI